MPGKSDNSAEHRPLQTMYRIRKMRYRNNFSALPRWSRSKVNQDSYIILFAKFREEETKRGEKKPGTAIGPPSSARLAAYACCAVVESERNQLYLY